MVTSARRGQSGKIRAGSGQLRCRIDSRFTLLRWLAVGPTPHQCPNDGRAEITPTLPVKCGEGPDGRCVPVVGKPTGPGESSTDEWTENKSTFERSGAADQEGVNASAGLYIDQETTPFCEVQPECR